MTQLSEHKTFRTRDGRRSGIRVIPFEMDGEAERWRWSEASDPGHRIYADDGTRFHVATMYHESANDLLEEPETPSGGHPVSEMVERVARAIAIVTIPDYADDAHWKEHWAWYLCGRGQGGSADHSTQARAEKQARAAIGALREPTDEMVVAGTEQWLCEAAMEDRSEVNWRAMIDEALR